MDSNTDDPTSWRGVIATFGVMGAALGIEQALPIPDNLRMQIGVLIVLLTFDFWNLLRALILPEKHKDL